MQRPELKNADKNICHPCVDCAGGRYLSVDEACLVTIAIALGKPADTVKINLDMDVSRADGLILPIQKLAVRTKKDERLTLVKPDCEKSLTHMSSGVWTIVHD